MPDMLVAEDLRAHYRPRTGAPVRALDGVSLRLGEGEVLGIAGESGCGKSTLGRVLAALLDPPLYRTSGRVLLEGDDLFAMPAERLRREVLGRRVSYIPQAAMSALNPTRRVVAFVRDVMRTHFGAMSRDEVLGRARARFESLSLSERVLRSYPFQLSGGMQQRAVVAVSTLLNPAVLIADEPTSALDVSTQKALVLMLRDLVRQGIARSLIFITHDLAVLRHICSRIAVMYAGEFVEVGSADQIVSDPAHPYTRALVNSILLPEPGTRGRTLEGLAGAPPDLRATPAGCRFAPRCGECTPECQAVHAELRTVRGRLVRCARLSEDTEVRQHGA